MPSSNHYSADVRLLAQNNPPTSPSLSRDSSRSLMKKIPRVTLFVPFVSSLFAHLTYIYIFFCSIFQANWFKAAQYCRFHGMHLASISSQEENDKLEKYVRDSGKISPLLKRQMYSLTQII